jgi:arylsulfatase A-like enzyme
VSHPNILFVFADQLRYDALGCNGNALARTPTLDALAAESVTLDRAYSSCPICAPYRGQVLTGNYSHVNGVICNEYRLFDHQRTLPQRLAEHGYRSGFIGKWHLGYGPYDEANRYGFDDLWGYNCEHNYYDIPFWRNEDGPVRVREYAPEHETRLTLEWIDRHRADHGDRPFLAMLGWGPPHWANPRKDYRCYPGKYRLFDARRMPVPDSVPEAMREFAAEETADYYGMVTSLDDCLGRLMDGLARRGLAEETIVCFSSDHGDHLGVHGYGKPSDDWLPPEMRASKATPLQEAVRIPTIIRWPRALGSGRRSDVLFNTVDVAPTLMSLAGLPVPEDVQGRDLAEALAGKAEGPDSVYLQILGTGWPLRSAFTGLWRGVCDGRYTYARWHEAGPRGGQRVLYDLETDPLQMRNLIDEPTSAGLAERMEQRLRRWMADTGDPFDTGERLPVTGMLQLGQGVTTRDMHDRMPAEYAKSIQGNYSGFTTGRRIEFG